MQRVDVLLHVDPNQIINVLLEHEYGDKKKRRSDAKSKDLSNGGPIVRKVPRYYQVDR